MNILPAKSIYRGYNITNNSIVARIFLNGVMIHYGEMEEEEAYKWIEAHKKEQSKAETA